MANHKRIAAVVVVRILIENKKQKGKSEKEKNKMIVGKKLDIENRWRRSARLDIERNLTTF